MRYLFNGEGYRRLLFGAWLMVWSVLAAAEQAEAGTQDLFHEKPELFALVDGVEIETGQFRDRIRNEAKNRFYHGRIPEGEVEAFLRDVGQNLIDEHLLLSEARRRQLAWNPQYVTEQLEKVKLRNKDNKVWQQRSAEWLPLLELRYQNESLINRLKTVARNVESPNETQVKAFYDTNPDKFTQPAQLRASLLFIAVPSYAASDEWEAARVQLLELKERLDNGEDFAELTMEFSSDPSAEAGGDLGFMHEGTLGEQPTAVLKKLAINEVSTPIQLLDGAALFKLTGREPALKTPFSQARQRAAGLLSTALGDLAWRGLLFELRQGSKILVNETHYKNPILKSP